MPSCSRPLAGTGHPDAGFHPLTHYYARQVLPLTAQVRTAYEASHRLRSTSLHTRILDEDPGGASDRGESGEDVWRPLTPPGACTRTPDRSGRRRR
jgi:hypothetical protein